MVKPLTATQLALLLTQWSGKKPSGEDMDYLIESGYLVKDEKDSSRLVLGDRGSIILAAVINTVPFKTSTTPT
ncbi:MAG: hypothetical protein C5B59_12675 [Bacteroidetes bacterium]|nr:MAG: hypothetical protein C5B59_12675 [Bacteroidota bacterium]